MNLAELVIDAYKHKINEGFILEFDELVLEDMDLLEEFEELLAEARNIATTTGKNLVYVKSLDALKRRAKAVINKGMKTKPRKNPVLIAKVRYLTKNGKPVEDNVMSLTLDDIELIKKSEENGTSKKFKLSKDQVRYKKSKNPGDYRILDLNNLFAIKVGDKVYTLKTHENVMEEYAKAAAPVVVEARKRLADINKVLGIKTPYVPTSEKEAEKYILDLLIHPQSKNAQRAKKKAEMMKKREMEAKMNGEKLPKEDFVISIDSYKDGKVNVKAQISMDAAMKAFDIPGITATKVPEDWSDTKAAWKNKAKEYKEELEKEIKKLAGPHAEVKMGREGGWITINFVK